MRTIGLAVAMSLVLPATVAASQASSVKSTTATPAPVGRYSTSTTPLGVLFADPAAKAVVAKAAPRLVGNPDVAERASGMTLKEIQEAVKAYSPDLLTDAVLAQIDSDLAKLPPNS